MSTTPQLSVDSTTTSSIRWTRIAPTIFVFWFLGLLDKFAMGIIVTSKPFLHDMALSNQFALIGLLTTVVVFAQAAGNFLFGSLTDVLGPRRSAILGSLVWAMSTAISALAPNLLVMLVARTLLGLAEGYTWPVANSLTARWFPLSERGRAKAVWLSATCIGPGVSGYIVGSCLTVFSWRGVFWLLTGISLLICLPLILAFLKDYPAKDRRVSREELALIEADYHSNSPHQSEVPALLPHNKMGTANFWLATIAAIGISVSVWALAAWLPSYLANAKHLSLSLTKDYLLIAYFVALVANFVWGRIIDKTSRRALWGGLAFVVGGVLIFFAGELRAAPSILLLIVMVSLLYGVAQPVTQDYIHKIAHPSRMGLESGVMQGVSNVFASIGPTLMGALIGVAHGGYEYAFLFLVLIFFISASASFMLMRRGF